MNTYIYTEVGKTAKMFAQVQAKTSLLLHNSDPNSNQHWRLQSTYMW